MERFRHLEDRLAAAGSSAARLHALNDLSLALTRAGDAERAMPLAREAEDLAVASGDDAALSLSLCNIGTAHYLCAAYGAGLEACLHAFAIAERAGNSHAMATALVSAAGCQYQMGLREEALQALYQALEAMDDKPCDLLLIRVHNALGVILGDKGRFGESEAHYRHALELGAGNEDAIYTARVKMNYAGLHLDRGRLVERRGVADEARAHYRAGLLLCEELPAGGGLEGAFNQAHCAGTMGELYCALGESERAQGLFAEMLEHATRMNNPHQQAEALMNLGKTHLALGRLADARHHLERAVELASGANVRRLIADGFLSLAAWQEASGDFEQSLTYYKRFHDLHEELLRAELNASGLAHQIRLKFPRLRREMDRLSRIAHEDSLTGLSNRRHLDARLDELVKSAQESGLRMCIGIVDIDHFKAINDQHSHSMGDTVLRTVASMIGAHCREGDISARYGGDEFVVCLVGAPLDAAVAVLERLRSLVANHGWGDLHPDLQVTLSIGVAEAECGDSVATLMARVDAALYRAKRAGRNCVVGAGAREPEASRPSLH